MRLLRLTLNNFKGVKNFTIEFGKSITEVRATNGKGKSSLMDAYLWLIKGKDKRDRADYDIKTRENDSVLHGLDHSVEAEYDSGLILKRTYREKWTKKRGSTDAEFTGHETVYSIDQLEVKASEYNSKVQEIFGDQTTFSLLSDPLFFSEMNWKSRRAIIAQVCGDVSDEEIFAANSDVVPVKALLNGKTADETLARLKQQQKRINDELDEQKIRLSEASKAIDRPTETIEELTKSMMAIMFDISAKKDAIKKVQSGTVDTTKERELLSTISEQLYQLEGKRTTSKKAAERENEQAIREAMDAVEPITAERNRKKLSVQGAEEQMQFLREEYAKVKAETEPALDEVCFNCGAPIDPGKIDEQRSAWNRTKAERLEAIQTKGKHLKAERDAVLPVIEELNTKIEQATKKITVLRAKTFTIAPESSDEVDLKKQIAALRTKIESASVADTSSLDAELNQLEESKKAIDEAILKHRAADKQVSRLQEIRDRQKTLSEQYQEAFADISLIESFLKTKMAVIEKNVFDKLGVNVKMFNIQINGGVEEICDILIDCGGALVPFQSANDGARIATGINIISKLAQHYDKLLPVWVDNAESVVKYPSYDGQLIKLIVDENYLSLNVIKED